MDPLEILRGQLVKLAEQRAALSKELRGIIEAAGTAGRTTLTEDEQKAYDEKRAALTKADAEIDATQARIADLEDDEKRAAAANAALAAAGQTGQRRSGGAVVTSEPQTYGQGSRNSYFLDMARAQVRGDREAADRLTRHGQELDVELPKREAARARRAEEQLGAVGGSVERRSAFEQRVNPNRTDGQGGYFVPPLWLVDQYIDLPRFGRVTANLCQNFELPAGTDSINVPKISTGTATGVQTADAAAVSSTDLTDTSVSASVRTIAGQQDISMQLLDQSPVNFDEIVFADLMADYNLRLDIQTINGSGASGQHLGILNVGSINSVTYTDATPTLPELYVPLAQAASLVAKNRKLPATAAVVLPSIWYWASAQLDTANRPLIVPPQVGFNPAATSPAVLAGVNDGTPAGMLSMGLPAYLDGNLPTNLGAGTNETRIIVARWSDLYLWEGPLRSRVLTEVLSGTLQVRLQVFAYSAFMAGRRPEAISVVSGTGLIPTAGY